MALIAALSHFPLMPSAKAIRALIAALELSSTGASMVK